MKRLVGMTLVLAGFGWLSIGAYLAPVAARAVIVNHQSKLEELTPCSQDEVSQILVAAAYDVSSSRPHAFAPGLLMLLGALLIGHNSRGEGVPNKTPGA